MSRKFLTPIELPADPVNPLEAVTKQYVDAADVALDGRLDTLEAAAAAGYRPGPPIYFQAGTGNFVKASYPGLRAILVECIGSGGGHVSISSTTASGEVVVSSGGSGAWYARSLILASVLAASEPYSVGASVGNTNGLPTWLRSSSTPLVLAIGGVQGASSGVAAFATATVNGVQPGLLGANTGDLLVPGAASFHGFASAATRVHSGRGGDGPMGFGIGGQANIISGSGAGAGVNGQGYGAGGSGGGRAQNQTNAGGNAAGGNSAPGLMIITPLY